MRKFRNISRPFLQLTFIMRVQLPDTYIHVTHSIAYIRIGFTLCMWYDVQKSMLNWTFAVSYENPFKIFHTNTTFCCGRPSSNFGFYFFFRLLNIRCYCYFQTILKNECRSLNKSLWNVKYKQKKNERVAIVARDLTIRVVEFSRSICPLAVE